MANTSTIFWTTDGSVPDVKSGDMAYCFVATGDGNQAFGAYYLNGHKLNYEDCPDATKENGWASCKSCSDCDGHLSTGWFDEQQSSEYDGLYFSLDTPVIAWAVPPVFRSDEGGAS